MFSKGRDGAESKSYHTLGQRDLCVTSAELAARLRQSECPRGVIASIPGVLSPTRTFDNSSPAKAMQAPKSGSVKVGR